MTPTLRTQHHAHEPGIVRSTCTKLLKRGLRALAIAPLLTTSLNARLIHEPQEPLNLMPAFSHMLWGAATKAPDSAASAPAARLALALELVPIHAESMIGHSGAGLPHAANAWRAGVRLRHLAVTGEAFHGTRAGEDLRLDRNRSEPMDFSGAFGPDSEARAPPRREQHALPHGLAREHGRPVIRTSGFPADTATVRASADNTPRPPRASSSHAANAPRADPAVQRDGAALQLTAEEQDGAGHMELHWRADDVGLSTFVGGSKTAEAACCTAFGRDVGAEVGLQFLDEEARAYRVLVAQSFQNELNVPVQEISFQFEVNLRF